MSNIYKGELQDYQGNTVYGHSEADLIFCADGETVQQKLSKQEQIFGEATGSSGSLEVNDPKVLATTEATHKLAENMGNCKFTIEEGAPYVSYEVNGETVKKKLGSGDGTYRITYTGTLVCHHSVVGNLYAVTVSFYNDIKIEDSAITFTTPSISEWSTSTGQVNAISQQYGANTQIGAKLTGLKVVSVNKIA